MKTSWKPFDICDASWPRRRRKVCLLSMDRATFKRITGEHSAQPSLECYIGLKIDSRLLESKREWLVDVVDLAVASSWFRKCGQSSWLGCGGACHTIRMPRLSSLSITREPRRTAWLPGKQCWPLCMSSMCDTIDAENEKRQEYLPQIIYLRFRVLLCLNKINVW